MQNFVNNWSAPVVLAPGATELAVALPDGTYLLTLADSLTAATRWEIVQAVAVSGSAALTRAREGTTDQDWPEGSVMYISVTAGFLVQVQQQIADLLARVAALEAGGIPDNALVDGAGEVLVDGEGEILTAGETA